MAHFARISDGVVREVIVVNNSELIDANGIESEARGQKFLASLGLDGEWVQTSYSGSTRGKYAGLGDAYDTAAKVFTAPGAAASKS